MGVCDREFRVVDRHWPRRDIYFRDFTAALSILAHCDQSAGRGDDAFRRRVRGLDAAAPSRPALGLLLAFAISRYDGRMAAISQPAGVGHFRSRHLSYRFYSILVPRTRT